MNTSRTAPPACKCAVGRMSVSVRAEDGATSVTTPKSAMSTPLRIRATFGACPRGAEVPFTFPDLTNDPKPLKMVEPRHLRGEGVSHPTPAGDAADHHTGVIRRWKQPTSWAANDPWGLSAGLRAPAPPPPTHAGFDLVAFLLLNDLATLLGAVSGAQLDEALALAGVLALARVVGALAGTVPLAGVDPRALHHVAARLVGRPDRDGPRAAVTVSVRAGGAAGYTDPRRDVRAAAGELARRNGERTPGAGGDPVERRGVHNALTANRNGMTQYGTTASRGSWHPRDDYRPARCGASRARFARDLQSIGQRRQRGALGDQAGAARVGRHGAERRPRGAVPRPCLVGLSGRCRRELGEGDHRDASAGTAAVARVCRFRRSGHGSQPEVHAVARGHQGQRAIIPRQRRVLGAVADAESRQQADGDERRTLRSERAAELLEARPDACLRRAERQAELGRDLLVREVVEEGETECFALRRWKLVECRLQDGATVLLPRCLCRPGVAGGETREHEPLWVGYDLWLAAPAAQLVQEAEVCDLQDPRAHRAPLGFEPSGVAPDRQEDLLDEVFGSRPIERLDGQAEDHAGEATVEQPECLRGAVGDLAHQLLVAGGVLRRSHPPLSVHASVHCRRVGVRDWGSSGQAFHRTISNPLLHRQRRSGLGRRRGRADETDEAQADEEEHGEGHTEDQGAVGIRPGGDEARCGPEAHQD